MDNLNPSTEAFTLAQPQLLGRLFAAERKLLVLTGTLPALVGPLQDKYQLARMTFEDASHAEGLRRRLQHLRGAKGRELRLEPKLDVVFEAALRVPSPAGIVEAIFGVFKRAMLRAYEQYLRSTHPVGDASTCDLLASIIEQERAQVEYGLDLAARMGAGVDEDRWCARLSELLAAAGGVDGMADEPCKSPLPLGVLPQFKLPDLPAWDDHPIRMRNGDASPDEDLMPHCFDEGTDPRIMRVGMYVWLLHESDVLDYLPPMFHATQGMPFDFQLDLARHLWDEARHSEGGWRGLQRLGFDPRDSDHPVVLRLCTKDLSPVELYAVMTLTFEAGSFPLKTRLIRDLDTLRDDDLSAFLRYDRADETMHVSYGHRWVPELAKLCEDERPVQQIVEETRARFFDVLVEHTAASAAIPRTVPPERRITYNSVAARYGLPPRDTACDAAADYLAGRRA